jgi:TRAP-type C4-dicarboxylate transport system permease small subunit
MDMDELYGLLWFVGKLFLEAVCAAAWIVLAWCVNEYLARVFPLKGLPLYILYLIEIIFGVATIVSLLKLLFRRHKESYARPWWQ